MSERDAYERAARLCEEIAATFLSPEYATGQPLSSFSERHACGVCAAAIRALADAPVEASPRQVEDASPGGLQ